MKLKFKIKICNNSDKKTIFFVNHFHFYQVSEVRTVGWIWIFFIVNSGMIGLKKTEGKKMPPALWTGFAGHRYLLITGFTIFFNHALILRHCLVNSEIGFIQDYRNS